MVSTAEAEDRLRSVGRMARNEYKENRRYSQFKNTVSLTHTPDLSRPPSPCPVRSANISQSWGREVAVSSSQSSAHANVYSSYVIGRNIVGGFNIREISAMHLLNN